jgi:hypothetical protein
VYLTFTDGFIVRGIPFQDAGKAGLQFGDEGEPYWQRFVLVAKLISIIWADLDPEEEKAIKTETKEKFMPLLSWLKTQAQDVVRDGSYRIVPPFSSISNFSCNSRDL